MISSLDLELFLLVDFLLLFLLLVLRFLLLI